MKNKKYLWIMNMTLIGAGLLVLQGCGNNTASTPATATSTASAQASLPADTPQVNTMPDIAAAGKYAEMIAEAQADGRMEDAQAYKAALYQMYGKPVP